MTMSVIFFEEMVNVTYKVGSLEIAQTNEKETQTRTSKLRKLILRKTSEKRKFFNKIHKKSILKEHETRKGLLQVKE